MSHAEVAALIESAALVPGRLRALVGAESGEAELVRAHLAECEECRGELDAWQAVDEALVAVTPPDMRAPAAARGRILTTVLATGVARSPDRMLGAPGVAATAAGGARATTPGADADPAGGTPPAAAAAPAEPTAGRVWRSPSGKPMPSPTATIAPPGAAPTLGVSTEPLHATHPGHAAPATAGDPGAHPSDGTDPAARRRGLRVLSGDGDRDGVGFRVFLAVAAAAVFLFALGAALGGPLGLSSPTTIVQPDTTARVELEKALGRMSDLLQQPGAVVAPLTDQAGEPAGAVVIAAPDSDLLGVVTRSLPAPEGDQRYVCLLIRDGERYEVGYMRFASDPDQAGEVAYWVGPIKDPVPFDAGAPGDVFSVYLEGDTGGQPLLTATF